MLNRARPFPVSVLVLAGLALAAPDAAWCAQPPPRVAPPARQDSAADLQTLTDPDSERAARRAAAGRLIATPDAGVRDSLARLLREAPDPAQPATDALLRTISSLPDAPTWLAEPLGAALKSARTPALAEAIAAALGSVRTQAAARSLVDAARPPASRTVREACLAALERLTGHTEPSQSLAAWDDWLERVEFLPETEWRRILLTGLTRRADDLARTASSAIDRLVEVKRREYLELPADGNARSDLLGALLADNLSPLRRLGIELVKRELANGRVPDPVIVESAVELLADPAPEFRTAGAELLAALAPRNAGEIVADALGRERDPVAAGAMLQAAARWPSEQIRDAAIQWLRDDPVAGPGAIQAVAALSRAGLLNEADDRRTVARLLLELPPPALSDTATWLLVQVGGPDERATVAGWLDDPSPAMRVRAAEALAAVPEGLDPILSAASDDPGLLAAAGRAVRRFRPSAAGLLTLAALPSSSAEARIAALGAAAEALPLADLVEAAGTIEPPAVREALLARLPALATRNGPPDAPVIAGIVLLARTRLTLGQPARAVEAIDALEAAGLATLPPDAVIAKATALVWLNRLADAGKLDAPASAWLDGLERAITLPHAPAVVVAINNRFGDRLAPADQVRLETLRQRASVPPPPPDPRPPGG